MTAHDSQLALDLAAAYLDAAFDGRDPRLTAVCAAHPHLARQVASVLRAGGQLAEAADRADDEPMPTRLGKYRLTAVLGRGAMGVVYRGRDPDLGRDVAVKLLRASVAGVRTVARRFLNEARTTARLEHASIPAVHEIGTHTDGRPWLAMRLARGVSLDRLLAEPGRGFDPLAAFEAVCRGVAHAHANGVIHRDLKPQNVMVAPDGTVQILDWGLARVLVGASDDTDFGSGPAGADAALTQTGDAIGSPAYMPPEQAAGAANRADRRSDVFGLGAILCHLLTGMPPFVGSDAGSALRLAALGRVRPAAARLDRCGADPRLVALCKRCLSRRPGARPADAREVADAVAAARRPRRGRLAAALGW